MKRFRNFSLFFELRQMILVISSLNSPNYRAKNSDVFAQHQKWSTHTAVENFQKNLIDFQLSIEL